MQCLAWLYAQFRTYICHVFYQGGKGVHHEYWGGRLEKEGLSHELRYHSPEQLRELEVSCCSWWRKLSGLNNALTQYITSPISASGSHECHQLMWALEQAGLTLLWMLHLLVWPWSSWKSSVHISSPGGSNSSPFALGDSWLYADLNNDTWFAAWLWTCCSASTGCGRRVPFGRISSLGDFGLNVSSLSHTDWIYSAVAPQDVSHNILEVINAEEIK